MARLDLNRRHLLLQFGTIALASAASRVALAQTTASTPLRPNAQFDQTQALQAALNRAARSGQELVLPAGVYKVSTLHLPVGGKLIGAGPNTILQGLTSGPVVQAQNLEHIALQSFAISAVTKNTGALDVRNVEHVHVENLKVTNETFDGIYAEQCGGTIENCEITKCGRFGLYSVQGRSLSIQNNMINACSDGGIILHRWEPGVDGTTVQRNVIHSIASSRGGRGQWGNGINVFQADDVEVVDNDIDGCAFSAIRMNSAKNTQILRNKCLNSGETAIYAEFAFRDAFIAENYIDGAANGISATNFDRGGRGSRITGNYLFNLTAPGPYEPEAPFFGHGVSVEAESLVEGNHIEIANGFGINAGWGPFLKDVRIQENTIKAARFGIGVSVVEGAGGALLRKNKIQAREGAIKVHRWAEILPKNLMIDPNPHRNIKLIENTNIQ